MAERSVVCSTFPPLLPLLADDLTERHQGPGAGRGLWRPLLLVLC